MPSALPEARVWPSGLNATVRTDPPCPVSVVSSWRLVTCHTFSVPSALAVASRVESGLKATALIGPVCPKSRPAKAWDWLLSSALRASVVGAVRKASSASSIEASGLPAASAADSAASALESAVRRPANASARCR